MYLERSTAFQRKVASSGVRGPSVRPSRRLYVGGHHVRPLESSTGLPNPECDVKHIHGDAGCESGGKARRLGVEGHPDRPRGVGVAPGTNATVGLGEFGCPFDGVVAVLDVGGLVLVAPHPEVFAVGGVAAAHVLDNDRIPTFCDVGGMLLVAWQELVIRGSAD